VSATAPPGTVVIPPVLTTLAGQDEAQRLLAGSLGAPVHAYLFVGPPGVGAREGAIAFAAALICPQGGCGICTSCQAVLAGVHPDVALIERSGAAVSIESVRDAGEFVQRTPRLAPRVVCIITDFHLAERSGPALLKALEEPPDTAVFCVVAESIPPSLQTIASRCVTVAFHALDIATIEDILQRDGADTPTAAAAAAGAGGRLDRARLLVADPEFAARRAWWAAIPGRLDGTGSTVATLVSECATFLTDLLAVLRAQQEAELAALSEAAERAGERRIPGRQAIEDRHRREQRRVRTDELRAGLATLAGVYRGRLLLADAPPARRRGELRAIDTIDATAGALVRNPTEDLLLEALFVELDALD
jgi:DNA polymerase III subunit delta'